MSYGTDRNDELKRADGARIVAINGEEFEYDFNNSDDATNAAPSFNVGFARVTPNQCGSLNIIPEQGWQMQPLYLPAPEVVWHRFIEIAKYSYQNVYLSVHLGFVLGVAVGIPLGHAMGCPTGSVAGLIQSWNSCVRCHHLR